MTRKGKALYEELIRVSSAESRDSIVSLSAGAAGICADAGQIENSLDLVQTSKDANEAY